METNLLMTDYFSYLLRLGCQRKRKIIGNMNLGSVTDMVCRELRKQALYWR
jgi:hypothetical protein